MVTRRAAAAEPGLGSAWVFVHPPLARHGGDLLESSGLTRPLLLSSGALGHLSAECWTVHVHWFHKHILPAVCRASTGSQERLSGPCPAVLQHPQSLENKPSRSKSSSLSAQSPPGSPRHAEAKPGFLEWPKGCYSPACLPSTLTPTHPVPASLTSQVRPPDLNIATLRLSS